MVTLADIATFTGCSYYGDGGQQVLRPGALADLAEPGVFAFSRHGGQTKLPQVVGAVLMLDPQEHHDQLQQQASGLCLLFSGAPERDYYRAIGHFFPPRQLRVGISADAVIGADVRLGCDLYVAPKVVIEPGATIGDRVQIYPGSYIGAGVIIGADTIIYPQVTLYDRVVVGAFCILHAGCVVGSDGFGFVPGENIKKSQYGSVEIGDHVELGASCAVDCGTFGNTTIGVGVKLDNMVHIGHNVQVEPYCLITAQVVVGGSAKIGHHTMIGGQTAIADHVSIGPRTLIVGNSTVIADEPGGRKIWGAPAIEALSFKRQITALARLPQLVKDIRAIKKAIFHDNADHD